jgi:hypothetical protein
VAPVDPFHRVMRWLCGPEKPIAAVRDAA